MRKFKWWPFLIILIMICSGCNVDPAPATNQAQIEIKETATPTGGAIGGIIPSGGYLEIRIPFDLYSSDENLSGPSPICNVSVPFTIKQDDKRTMIEGEKENVCEYVDTPQGSPITFVIKIALSFDLLGELLPATIDKPAGFLDAYLAIEGAIIQYYTGYPAEATNPCPEDEPCETPIVDFIPLPLDFSEGSTLSAPWTFILHLNQ